MRIIFSNFADRIVKLCCSKSNNPDLPPECLEDVFPSPSPSPTPSVTPSITLSITPSMTLSVTPSMTPTPSPTPNVVLPPTSYVCDPSDNFCFSALEPLNCGCVFNAPEVYVSGEQSGSIWRRVSVSYNGPDGQCDNNGDCSMIVIRGSVSIRYPGSPLSNWIIGEKVDMVLGYAPSFINTFGYICGTTLISSNEGVYEGIVLRCTPPAQPPDQPDPPDTSNLSVVFMRAL